MGDYNRGGQGRTTNRAGVTVTDEDFEPGEVKFRHRDGYGFVKRFGKPDAYFHVERLDPMVRDQMLAGAAVQVAVGNGKKGPVVLAVRIS